MSKQKPQPTQPRDRTPEEQFAAELKEGGKIESSKMVTETNPTNGQVQELPSYVVRRTNGSKAIFIGVDPPKGAKIGKQHELNVAPTTTQARPT